MTTITPTITNEGPRFSERQFYSWLVVLGLAAITVVVVTMWTIASIQRRNAALSALEVGVTRDIALAHLWTEEAIAGDPSIDPERDVYPHIDHARATLESALAGSDEFDSIETGSARRAIVSLLNEITTWREDARNRITHRHDSGAIGHQADQDFDQRFNEILAKSSRVASELRKEEREDQSIVATMQLTTILGLILVFAALGWTVRRHARELERRSKVEELSRALERALDEAQGATRAKSAFLANMSHEIRTPLSAVIGFADLLLDTQLTAEQHEYAETIRSAGQTLLALISDVLDFSKIEAGKLDLERLSFDVTSLFENTIDLVAPQAASKNLELIVVIDDDVPVRAVGDPTRIRQVLTNLLSNAVKFTKSGEIQVRVRCAEGTTESAALGRGSNHDACVLRVSVRDTGVGIAAKTLAQLFQPFVQADVSTTREYGGTGLGLVISRRLSELMGGHLWAISEKGGGSTFSFSVPLAVDHSSTPDPRAETTALQGRSILAVDDNAANRELLAHQLARFGATATIESTPNAVLARIGQKERFDCALLDFHMPGMDGIQLASELARLDPSLRVLILSSLGLRYDEDAPPNVRGWLTKPIHRWRLHDAIVSLLAGQSIDTTLLAAPTPQASNRGRVLIAEDNAINQRVVRRMIERLGWDAEVVGDGAEALRALEQATPERSFDVLLLDMQMPEIDGYEVARRLRQRPRASVPYVVALTAHATVGDRERCIEAGADDYVPKPIDIERLRQALATGLEGRSRIAAHAAHKTLDGKKIPMSVIDPAGLESFERGEARMEFFRVCSQNVPGQLNAVLTSLTRGDGEQARVAAHKLKGTARVLSAIELAKKCQRIEDCTRTDLASARVAAEGLALDVAAVLAEVERWASE